MADSQATLIRKTSSVDSSFPVVLPKAPALDKLENLEHYVCDMLSREPVEPSNTVNEEELSKMDIDTADTPSKSDSKFITALKETEPKSHLALETAKLKQQNQKFTENADVTNISTKSPLLDLFVELEKTIDPHRLETLLELAWQADALATLKIVWNARSIHLGKGEHDSFYRCLGWLRQHHPATLLLNMEWLTRSVIEKKVKQDDPDAMVVVEKDELDAVISEVDGPDVLYGASHGYWKDLLNLLALDVEGQLKVDGNVGGVLHKRNDQGHGKKRKRPVKGPGGARKSSKSKDSPTEPEKSASGSEKPSSDDKKPSSEEKQPAADQREHARQKRHAVEAQRHAIVLDRLQDPRYQALHFCVARLFAQRLEKDKALLNYEDRKARKQISLAAKWAPSLEGFHDKYTLIATSIAELLHPPSETDEKQPREDYLKRAREAYRFHHLGPLRKELAVVERDITAETFNKINYAKVPSIAMNNYKDLFARKDLAHFEKYVEKVAAGKAKISGAVLLPGNLVAQARQQPRHAAPSDRSKMTAKQIQDAKMAEIAHQVLDGQWKTLVQRIKDSGKLASAIAVCDVSGSMSYPFFADKTTPMDTSIGLALVLAEVVAPPFGGHFITFSGHPTMESIDLTASFGAKVHGLERAEWGGNTDFVAVFERLILPAAIEHQLAPEDMVKTVFVFSDMQFDTAQPDRGGDRWQTSFERVKGKYAEAGYELPHLVFWNLAGGRATSPGDHGMDFSAPKPVTMDDVGCTLVSGYSQAMLKMFLDEGTVGEGEEELEEVKVGEDGTVVTKAVKKTKDPMDGLWKAIGHKAFDMLRVYD